MFLNQVAGLVKGGPAEVKVTVIDSVAVGWYFNLVGLGFRIFL